MKLIKAMHSAVIDDLLDAEFIYDENYKSTSAEWDSLVSVEDIRNMLKGEYYNEFQE